jgi:hypothetical protein
MKSPPPRQAQLELAERLVAGIFQYIFRLDSSARFRSGNKPHTHLLLPDRVARAGRRNATRRKSAEAATRGRKREYLLVIKTI